MLRWGCWGRYSGRTWGRGDRSDLAMEESSASTCSRPPSVPQRQDSSWSRVVVATRDLARGCWVGMPWGGGDSVSWSSWPCHARAGHADLAITGGLDGRGVSLGWCVSVGAGSSRRDRQDCGDRLPGARGVLAESVGNMCMAWEGRSALCWIAPSCIEPRDDALHARPHHGGRREGTEGGNLGREGRTGRGTRSLGTV